MADPATQQFLEVQDIREGVVLLKNNSIRGVLMSSSINFALKGEEEQTAIIYAFQTFLNSLDFFCQIVVQSRHINITSYLDSIRDLEEKQRIIKDRILLIGQNLIEMKEDVHLNFLEIKKEVEIMKRDIERLKSFFETISGELSRFAKKDDLEILSKQAKMFQPLEFITRGNLEKLKNN